MEKKEITPQSRNIAPIVRSFWNSEMPKGYHCPVPSNTVIALIIEIMTNQLELLSTRRIKTVLKAYDGYSDLPKATKEESEDVPPSYTELDRVVTEYNTLQKKKDMLQKTIADVQPYLPVTIFSEVEDTDEPAIFENRRFMKPADFIDAKTKEVTHNGRPGQIDRYQNIAANKDLLLGSTDAITNLEALAIDMPNFADVIDDIRAQVSAQQMLGMPIKLSSIVLAGPPGVGKTRFINKLAECIGLEHNFFQGAGATDVMKLKGLSQSWGSSKPGSIAAVLRDVSSFNPIFAFDEIDKVGTRYSNSNMGDTHSFLLSLLERETSCKIEDEYIAKPMDLTCINWIFTANDVTQLPDYFMSRVDVYDIKPFSKEQTLQVARNIVDEVIESEYRGSITKVELDVYDLLAKYPSARVMRRAVFLACAHTIANGGKALQVDYFKPPEEKIVRTMGFT